MRLVAPTTAALLFCPAAAVTVGFGTQTKAPTSTDMPEPIALTFEHGGLNLEGRWEFKSKIERWEHGYRTGKFVNLGTQRFALHGDAVLDDKIWKMSLVMRLGAFERYESEPIEADKLVTESAFRRRFEEYSEFVQTFDELETARLQFAAVRGCIRSGQSGAE
mmetsp:Transcript_81835/g.250062  ORF Transcript_81835/g.250062 Transcript_81835/m.250062 type:complete len:163 (-) Transcript_81835:86-574(-)